MAKDQGTKNKESIEELYGEAVCHRCGKESEQLHEYDFELICVGCCIDEFQKVWSGYDGGERH